MIVLDTNVISEIMKPEPSSTVGAWMSNQIRTDLFTTVITVAEVLYGIELLPRGKRHEALLREANATFAEDFAGQILNFDESAARVFALISATRRIRGRPISTQDAQIAAVARVHGATLATCNKSDFEDCGLVVIDPWQA